ncbi:DUF6213 family protein [Streptomyces sp. NPDC096339]|uniref:DUF6213 family protein n=1 Tax=Streptomyces sp. NPDC096339 TaxID=3366086 RepID=UPI00380315BD
MSESIPLVSASGGSLMIPADEVTALLRRIAVAWLRSDEGDTELDPGTMRALAGVLGELADQIDVECIGSIPSVAEGAVRGVHGDGSGRG